MASCPNGPPVPYSHFNHASRWDELFPKLAQTPLFCVEKTDVNGDGVLDEVGHLANRCNSQKRQDGKNPCSRHNILPFSLGGPADPATVSVRIESGPYKDQMMTVLEGDLVSSPAKLGKDDRLITRSSVLTFDPSRLVVVKTSGLHVLEEKVGLLVDTVMKGLSFTEKAKFVDLCRGFLASPTFENAIGTIRWLNQRVPEAERLTEPQMTVLANLIVRYRATFIRQLTHPDRLVASIPGPIVSLEKYLQAVLGQSPFGGYLSDFQDATHSSDLDPGGYATWNFHRDISDQMTLDADELFEIEHTFGTKRLVLRDADPYGDSWNRPLGETMSGAVALDRPAEGVVWAYQYSDNNGEEHHGKSAMALPVVGYYQFTNGAIPPDGSTTATSLAVEVQQPDGSTAVLSGLDVYYPRESASVAEDPLLKRSAPTGVLESGDPIGVTYRIPPEGAWSEAAEIEQETTGTIDQIAWRPFGEGSYLIFAHDDAGNRYEGPFRDYRGLYGATIWSRQK